MASRRPKPPRGGASIAAIKRFESEAASPNMRTHDKLVAAFQKAGVEFLGDSGVNLRRKGK